MLPNGDEDRLLLIPGPTPVTREILSALSLPPLAHTSKPMASVFSRVLESLRSVADCHQGPMFVLAGSGTLAQETALINFVTPEDRLLVASTGFFASRLTEIAEAHGLTVETMEMEWGRGIDPDELRQRIESSRATAVAFTHVETSTGVMVPLIPTLGVIRESGAMSIVDGVAAFAGTPEEVDGMGIDVLLSASQKALGVPPGLAILAANSTGWKRRTQRGSIPTFYMDLARWEPIMRDPEKYFATPAVNLIRALEAALTTIEHEGLPERFERHDRLARKMRTGLLSMGFHLFTDPEFLAPTLSVVRTPEGMSASKLRQRLRDNGVVVAGGIGDTEDRVLRVGHMGNVTEAEIAVALDAFERSLT